MVINLKIRIIPRKKFKSKLGPKEGGAYYISKNLIEIDEKLSQGQIIGLLFHEFTHFIIDKIYEGKIIGEFNASTKTVAIDETTKKRFKKIDNLEQKFANKIQKLVRSEVNKFLLRAARS